MAHFAEIDENNVVIRVLVTDERKPAEGYYWLLDRFGGTWIKTSYNTQRGQHLQGGTPLRGNFAGIGYTYDPDLDAFIPPSPFPSWVMDEAIFDWVAPEPFPSDGGEYVWDEESVSWIPYVGE